MRKTFLTKVLAIFMNQFLSAKVINQVNYPLIDTSFFSCIFFSFVERDLNVHILLYCILKTCVQISTFLLMLVKVRERKTVTGRSFIIRLVVGLSSVK